MPVDTSGLKYPLSLQDAFNRAWHWAVVEKRPRCIVDGACRYRSADGTNACLLGACIPDEELSFWRDGSGGDLRPIGVKSVEPESYERVFNGTPPAVLNELQFCHDWASVDDELATRLTAFANRNALTIPPA